jgi:hypothetical protein
VFFADSDGTRPHPATSEASRLLSRVGKTGQVPTDQKF